MASTVNFIFGYTGRETDEESLLQFNRARYTTLGPVVGSARIQLDSRRKIQILLDTRRTVRQSAQIRPAKTGWTPSQTGLTAYSAVITVMPLIRRSARC